MTMETTLPRISLLGNTFTRPARLPRQAPLRMRRPIQSSELMKLRQKDVDRLNDRAALVPQDHSHARRVAEAAGSDCKRTVSVRDIESDRIVAAVPAAATVDGELRIGVPNGGSYEVRAVVTTATGADRLRTICGPDDPDHYVGAAVATAAAADRQRAGVLHLCRHLVHADVVVATAVEHSWMAALCVSRRSADSQRGQYNGTYEKRETGEPEKTQRTAVDRRAERRKPRPH